MDALTRVLDLVQRALDEIGQPNIPLSITLNKAIRVARLRGDYGNLWSLSEEMVSFEDKDARFQIEAEIKPHYTTAEYAALRVRRADSYYSERSIRTVDDQGRLADEKKVLALSVAEIESRVDHLNDQISTTVTPQGLHPVDLYFVDQTNVGVRSTLSMIRQEYLFVLKRVEHRVHEFLSTTERELVFGQMHSHIFERNRQYVESRLRAIAPNILDQFNSVYRRLSEADPEARSQALTTCRRILKSVADHVNPATEQSVTGSDGKEHGVAEDMFVNRLWQFVNERVGGRTAGKLLLTQVSDLGSRIDRVNDLASKGVHSDVPEFEMNQCVIQTWLTVGDILRLADQDSAILADNINGDESRDPGPQ